MMEAVDLSEAVVYNFIFLYGAIAQFGPWPPPVLRFKRWYTRVNKNPSA